MKRLVARLLAVALIVVGIGFYRGWFTVSRPHDAGTGKVNVILSTDTGKMKDDAEAVKDKARTLTGGEGASDDVAGEQPSVGVTPNNP